MTTGAVTRLRDPGAEAIRHILAAHPVPGRLVQATRCLVAEPPLGIDRAGVWAKRIARKSRLLRRAVEYARHRTAAATVIV